MDDADSWIDEPPVNAALEPNRDTEVSSTSFVELIPFYVGSETHNEHDRRARAVSCRKAQNRSGNPHALRRSTDLTKSSTTESSIQGIISYSIRDIPERASEQASAG